MGEWQKVEGNMPPIGKLVETKIDDADGPRNIWPLSRGGINGRLWFASDGNYVYYRPTHWRSLQPLPPPPAREGESNG